MIEHTSKELSTRLRDKGFRGEHTHVWVYHYNDRNRGMVWSLCDIDEDDTVNTQIPAYTFSEIWGIIGILHRPGLMAYMLNQIHRADIAEVAGEWVEKHYEHMEVIG